MNCFYIAAYLPILLFHSICDAHGVGTSDFIVGGTEATEGEFPYQVVLERYGKPGYTGSLINHRWVLTSGSAINTVKAEHFAVKLGVIDKTEDVESIPIEEIVFHENSTTNRREYNIALLKLKHCVRYNKTIQPVVLHEQEIQYGTEAILTGYGEVDINFKPTNFLHEVNIKTISNTECAKISPELENNNSTFCSEPSKVKGACPADVGAPLVLPDNKEQIGILFGGTPCPRGKPFYFTAIYPYIDWIKHHTRH